MLAAMKRRLAAVLVALSACAGIGPGASGGPGKPVQGPDSLAMECPSEFRYELPLPAGASLAALRAHAEQRLQALGLQVNWDGPWAHAQAQRFGGEPAELARLRRLLAVVLPALERSREVTLAGDELIEAAEPPQLSTLSGMPTRPALAALAPPPAAPPVPTTDVKTEGSHARGWTLTDASSPIPMGPDQFFDGGKFDPLKPAEYLKGFPVHSLKVDLAKLAAANV